MTTDNAAALAPAPLTTKLILARCNQRLALLRTWISHDHGDEPFWWARETTARQAQAERMQWRWYATLLHVERATQRGRIHGTQFATLDAQRAWLEQHERKPWTHDGRTVTLVQLREVAVRE